MSVPLVVGYYADTLVGTDEDIHGGRQHWSFAIGSESRNRWLYADVVAWLRDHDFSSDNYFLVPHNNDQALVLWLDFFDANDAMRFRLVCGGTFREPRTFNGDM